MILGDWTGDDQGGRLVAGDGRGREPPAEGRELEQRDRPAGILRGRREQQRLNHVKQTLSRERDETFLEEEEEETS